MIQKSIKWYNRFPPYRIFAINKTKGTGKDEDMEKTEARKGGSGRSKQAFVCESGKEKS